MRCQCCNKNLTDYESVLRHPVTSEFLDICRKCLSDIPILPVEPSGFIEDMEYDNTEFINDINFDIEENDLSREY